MKPKKKEVKPIRKLKAVQLSKSKQLQIAIYKAKHPWVKYEYIADEFNVTYDQARHSYLRYKAGRLTKIKPSSERGKTRLAQKICDCSEPDSLLQNQFAMAISQLEADRDINVADRVTLLDKLTGIRRLIQQIELEGHLKRRDAMVIIAIIKRFKPEASTEDCIKIYSEELEKCKASAVLK